MAESVIEPVAKFNLLSNREKWGQYKNVEHLGKWFCQCCDVELEDGPIRAEPFHGSSRHCGFCYEELTRRTGGSQSDPFGWVLCPEE